MKAKLAAAAAFAAVGGSVLFAMAPWARGDVGRPGCTAASRACVISAASQYIKAFVTHDGSNVPLAPNARRTENGMVTGTSGPGIQRDLSNNEGDRAIYDARDIRWFVDGDEAVAYYLLDTAAPGTSSPHTTTVHLAERFKVDGGLIYQIEAIFWVSPGPAPEGSGWPN